MRDPSTLAHRIVSPFPTIRKQTDRERERYGHGLGFHWQVRLRPFAKHNYISPFIYVFGREIYFHSFIEIWHTDPLGDAGPACHGRKHWKWHIHHMRVSPSFWYDFKQKHITKCAWCGKKSSKELGRVNHSDGRTVYHATCSSEASKAHHAHDPRGCYACSGNSAWEFTRKKENTRRVARQLFGPKRVK